MFLPLIYKSPCSSIGTALKLQYVWIIWPDIQISLNTFLKLVDKLYFANSHILHDVEIEVHEAVYESV